MHGPPLRPRGGIKITEGCERWLPQDDAVGSQGKGKAVASSVTSLSREEPRSPPSLEALMSDLSLFEELLLKGSDEEVLSSLGALYVREAIKRVHALLKDATPFKMATSVP